MTDIVIAGGARTPIGRFNGGLSSLPPTKLGEIAVREALQRAKTEPGEVEEVVMGIVLQGNTGGGPARQVCINAGISNDCTAYAINQLCASGLRAIAEGYKSLKLGEHEVVVAGGMESMSWAPHEANLRSGTKMGDFKMVDSMLRDGLIDPFHNYHMGNTAENVAKKWQITRQEQDEFACKSQNKCEAAIKSGRFKDEIVPVTVPGRKGDVVVDTDEHPTFGTTMQSLSKLRPAFEKEGTVTAGNASGVNDAAAAVVLMTAENAKKRGVEPLARIVSWATTGVDPAIMGTGPIGASRKALQLAGWTMMTCWSRSRPTRRSLRRRLPSIARWAGSWSASTLMAAPSRSVTRCGSGTRIMLLLVHDDEARAEEGIATMCVGEADGHCHVVQRH